MRVLVTGATGYIGGRLIPRLLERGYHVRVLVRDLARIAGRGWLPEVEVVTGDLHSPVRLGKALKGMDSAYYLVHSMYSGREYAGLDRQAALNFVRMGPRLKHVIYLGGLVPEARRISRHLHSRAEVGSIIRAALPATEFRAGPVIGSGSASFELVRYLTERLPVILTPRWVDNAIQPIAVRDALAYLLAALPAGPSGVVEVGADRLSFRGMLKEAARARGLKTHVLKTLWLPTGLAAFGVELLTPIPATLAGPLIEGMRHPVVADTQLARELFPLVRPVPYARAVELALAKEQAHDVETRWSGALGAAPVYELRDWQGLITEVRTRELPVPPQRAFAEFTSIGGRRGWLVWQWAWWLRGMFDRIIGGPGLRRGRRDPVELLPGESVDFWRVETVLDGRLLRLRAEMKVPGRAWLQWEAVPAEGGCKLVQTAAFAPRGPWGALYWYALYPLHKLIFSDMIDALARECGRERADAQEVN